MHLLNLTLSRPSAITVRAPRRAPLQPLQAAPMAPVSSGPRPEGAWAASRPPPPPARAPAPPPPPAAVAAARQAPPTLLRAAPLLPCPAAVRHLRQLLGAQGARDCGGARQGAGAAAARRRGARPGRALHRSVWRHPLPGALQVHATAAAAGEGRRAAAGQLGARPQCTPAWLHGCTPPPPPPLPAAPPLAAPSAPPRRAAPAGSRARSRTM